MLDWHLPWLPGSPRSSLSLHLYRGFIISDWLYIGRAAETRDRREPSVISPSCPLLYNRDYDPPLREPKRWICRYSIAFTKHQTRFIPTGYNIAQICAKNEIKPKQQVLFVILNSSLFSLATKSLNRSLLCCIDIIEKRFVSMQSPCYQLFSVGLLVARATSRLGSLVCTWCTGTAAA